MRKTAPEQGRDIGQNQRARTVEGALNGSSNETRGRAEEDVMSYQTWVGVDVSKESLDVFVNPVSQQHHVGNDPSGIAEILAMLDTLASPLVVVEATGGYERAFFQRLISEQRAVVRVNPRQVRDFAKASGILAKTDRLDATVLAQFGKAMKPA